MQSVFWKMKSNQVNLNVMKLLLTSAGFTNKSISNALLELTSRPFSELKLAFIPTAANVEKGDKGWLIDSLYDCKKLGFLEIDVVDISALAKDIWKPRLENADVLLFGGGNTFHLIYWLEKSGLKEILPGMLKNKVYVGISAGSMVTAKKISLSQSEKLYYEDLDQYENENAMGFVDFQIRPHLNDPYFSKVTVKNLEEMAKEILEPIYAIDDNSAIKVVDDKVEVISEGEWKKFN
jgi:dipeptidase E